MSSYWVRPAMPGDGRKVRDLARRVVREFRLAARWPEPPPPGGEHGLMWVVEAGRGEIVGSCGLREAAAGVWELHSLFLAPEFRGYGIGRTLVENAVRVARDHGALKLVFSSPAEFYEAHALVQRLGFVAAGRNAFPPPPAAGGAGEGGGSAGELRFELELSDLA